MRLALRAQTLLALFVVLVFVNTVVWLTMLHAPSHAQSGMAAGGQFRAIRWQPVANQCATPATGPQGRDSCVLSAEQLFRGQTMEGWEFVTFITPPGLLIFRSR